MTTTSSPVGSSATNRRVLIGSLSGSAIEWYDFLLYASVAPIIFNKQFFGGDDPFLALMLAYLGNALTFFVRPFGGVVFAHIGDRIGRKKTLVLTLSLMGLGTVAIGLLPTYAQVGVLAPILLYACRIIQGLAIGGEWGGALLLAYEYAPEGRRGFFGSVPQMGVTLGLVMGNLALVMATLLPSEAFEAWGWRVPFVGSIVLLVIGLWIRRTLDETPAFREVRESGRIEKAPLAVTLRHHWRAVLIAICAKAVETAPFYIFVTFTISYATRYLEYTRTQALNAVLVAALLSTILIPVFGALSDRLGRRQVYLGGVALLVVLTVPYFLMLGSGNVVLLYLGCALALGLAWSPVTATLGTFMSETFTPEIRYTGITLGYQVGAALFSGTAPMVAEAMVEGTGGHWWPIPVYLLGLGALSFVAVSLSGRTARREAARTQGEMA